MRTEELYLRDILEAAHAIAAFVSGFDAPAFIADDRTRSAVLMKLVIIGEAAANVSDALQQRHPLVAWRSAKRMRDFAAHVYFGVVWQIVWDTATQDVPLLRSQIAAILAAEFPEDEP